MIDNHSLLGWRLLLLALLICVVNFNARLLAEEEIPAFNLQVTVTCPGNEETLGFKTAEGATIGMDPFDDPYPPEAFPPGSFFAHIIPVSGSGDGGFFRTDARPLAYDITWEFTVNLPPGTTAGSLGWDASHLQEKGWTVTLTSAGQKIDMLNQMTLQPLSAGSHNFTLSAEMKGVRTVKEGQFVNIKPGWNLLSPVLLDTARRGSNSELQEKAFGLQQGNMQVVKEYVFGRAYWIFNASGADIEQWDVEVIDYEGRPLIRESGWNFVGAVDISELLPNNEIAWKWSWEKQAFVNSEGELIKGFGYWIHQHQPPESAP